MKKFLLCVVVAFTTSIFSACEKDESGLFRTSDFVGLWKNGSIKHELSSNGTLRTDWGGGNGYDSKGKWRFDKRSNTFILKYDGDHGADYVFSVQSLSDDMMILLSLGQHYGTYSAGVYTFYRL